MKRYMVIVPSIMAIVISFAWLALGAYLDKDRAPERTPSQQEQIESGISVSDACESGMKQACDYKRDLRWQKSR